MEIGTIKNLNVLLINCFTNHSNYTICKNIHDIVTKLRVNQIILFKKGLCSESIIGFKYISREDSKSVSESVGNVGECQRVAGGSLRWQCTWLDCWRYLPLFSEIFLFFFLKLLDRSHLLIGRVSVHWWNCCLQLVLW